MRLARSHIIHTRTRDQTFGNRNGQGSRAGIRRGRDVPDRGDPIPDCNTGSLRIGVYERTVGSFERITEIERDVLFDGRVGYHLYYWVEMWAQLSVEISRENHHTGDLETYGVVRRNEFWTC